MLASHTQHKQNGIVTGWTPHHPSSIGAAVYATTRGDDIGSTARSVGSGTADAVGAVKDFVRRAHLPFPYHRPPSAYHTAYSPLTVPYCTMLAARLSRMTGIT